MQRLLLLAVMLGLVLVITVPAMGRDEDPNAEEPNTEERANAEEPQADAQSAGKKHGGGHNKKKNGDGGLVVEGPNFDDQKSESGSIETETNISIEGNNNNQCAAPLQFDQSGNVLNQQGTLQYASEGGGDNGFAGPETEFAPENGTKCEQGLEQASTASSQGGSKKPHKP